MTGAVLSVGTNSTRVLLAEYDAGEVDVLFAESRGTRLGEGLGPSGELQPHAIERTLDALRDFHGRIRVRYDRLWAVTTSAVRRADNASEFLDPVRALLGVSMDVLTGEEEARAAYRGAAAAIRPSAGERIGVIDSGGGSTEFAVGTGIEPDAVVSCEIGAVRLTEEVPELSGHSGAVSAEALERARRIARSAVAPLARFERGIRIALVGGSATTAAAIASGGLSVFDTAPLSRADLQRLVRDLTSMDVERRKRVPGMRAQRADILPGGMWILDTALGLLEAETAIASRWDLPLGVLIERAAGAPHNRNG